MDTGNPSISLRRSARRQASLESATDAPEACTNEQETGAPVRADTLESENMVGNTAGTVNTAPNDPNVAAVADQLQAAALSVRNIP
jgi:hypothetical protein